ncbi:MAG: asparagine synthase (glutamine-hydrolyzing) [Candidatus Dormibacteria bacterium]
MKPAPPVTTIGPIEATRVILRERLSSRSISLELIAVGTGIIGVVCGIAGWIDGNHHASDDVLREIAAEMAEAIRHRGPDSNGTWSDPRAGIAFAHDRLAVLDLSQHGHQPMASQCGRYVINYNGEMYNFREVRAHLQSRGVRFKGHSDTEVLLEAIALWGVEGALPRVNGMFAFALWDTVDRRLILARDRLGEKPLYYYSSQNCFVFASELGAIRCHPAVDQAVDRNSLALLLRYNHVPTPWSILAGTRKLPPACTLSVECADVLRVGDPVAYWSLTDAVDTPSDARLDDRIAADLLDELLFDAVRTRLESDVPLGAFLSGGIDSSSIVAMMQRASNRQVRTFTIGWPNASDDESRDAERVARHLGTDHCSLLLSATDVMRVVPRLSEIYSEPFADSSQIPTFLISELARRTVTVSLSGDGGDELFGGYNRYRWAPALWQHSHRVPMPIRRGLSLAMAAVPPVVWRAGSQLVPRRSRPRDVDVKASKVARILSQPSAWAMYQTLVAQWQRPTDVVLGATEPATIVADRGMMRPGLDLITSMQAMDLRTYLPDDILVKVDRASMAVSLEVRVPMLDHRLVEFAFSLPMSMKIRGRTSKWLLREVLRRYVPDNLTVRPKTGFAAPIAEWLRGPLHDWAADLLDPALLSRQGYFRPQLITDAWRAHNSGLQDRAHELWCVLMFQQWLDSQTSEHSRDQSSSG